MKKIFLLCAASWFMSIVSSQVTVAAWDFNSGADANTATGTILPNAGTGSLQLIGGTTSPSFNAGSPVDPNGADNSAWQTTTWPAQGTNPKTAGIQINVNTTGFNGLSLAFEQRLSNTAANTWVLQYTLDNSIGSPIWVDATTYTFVPTPGTGDLWWSRVYNFAAITGLNNNPNAGFRIVSDFDPTLITQYAPARSTSTYGVAGTSRFDMIRIMENAPTVQFAAAHQSVLENIGNVNATLNITTPNSGICKAVITTSIHTTATGGGTDYSVANDTVTFSPLNGSPQIFTFQVNDDIIPENAEYISFKIGSLINGIAGTNNFHIVYIRDNDYTPPTPTNEVMLQLLGSYSNGTEGTNSAEIVAYDSDSQKLVIANSIGAKLDIVDFSNPSAPGPMNSINISAMGNINSVAVNDGIIAVALENLAAQSNGKILFYDMTGLLLSQVDVGAMPDMIMFNNAGDKVYTVCEGEPNSSYSLDPEGTIAVVDISGGVAAVTNANVTIINFNSFDSQLATLTAAGVRVFGNNGTATVSQDFEPEYITISDDDLTAWVTLQENNAIALLDLVTNTVTQIIPLGTIDHSLVTNGMDASDQSSGINIANFPVKGLFMPDAIAHMSIDGTGYLFTANEGDSRAYTSPNNEESRISGLVLDPTVFVDQNILKSNFMLGRLNATNKTGDIDLDGDIDQIHVYGGRGFSVWTESGALVYNSGNLLEKIIANNPSFSNMFNASNTNGAIGLKNRSDDKGPEIEGVAVANIDGDNLLFASAERIGGVFIFNIDNPASPRYIGYYNNRIFATNGPDRGAEGIIYISAAQSPNGSDLVILANEISSTLSIFQVNTCASLSDVDVNYTPNDSICSGGDVTFSTPVGANTNLQWLMNNANLSGETGLSTLINQSGNYSLAVQNTALACSDTTEETVITVLSNPTVVIFTADSVACPGDQLTLDASGGTPVWNNGIIDNLPFTPAGSDMYVVTATDAFGCSSMDSIQVTVNGLPVVVANVTDNDICNGNSVTFSGAGADSYSWNNGVVDGVIYTPVSTNTYIITGTDANNCINTDTLTVTVFDLPTVVAAVTDNEICLGSSITFTGSGASTYLWNNGVTNGSSFTPASTNTYTVTGTDINTCSNTASILVTVHNLPTVNFNLATDSICYTSGSIILSGGTPAGGFYSGAGVTANSFNPGLGYGTYPITYTYTDGNGCSGNSADEIIVNPCLDIYTELNESISIYPNPADNSFYIQSSSNEVYSVLMMDMHGRVVMTTKVTDSEMIDISSLSSGVYIVELNGDSFNYRARMIKK